MIDTIYTEDDYREGLRRFLEICDTQEDTDELDKLMYLLQEYEENNCS